MGRHIETTFIGGVKYDSMDPHVYRRQRHAEDKWKVDAVRFFSDRGSAQDVAQELRRIYRGDANVRIRWGRKQTKVLYATAVYFFVATQVRDVAED